MSPESALGLFAVCAFSMLLILVGAVSFYLLGNEKKKKIHLERDMKAQKTKYEKEIQSLQKTLQDTGALEVLGVQKKLAELDVEKTKKLGIIVDLEKKENEINFGIAQSQVKLDELTAKITQSEKSVVLNTNKVRQLQIAFKSMQYSIDQYRATEAIYKDPAIEGLSSQVDELLSATVKVKLHLMDVRELRKLYKQTEKAIHDLFGQYKDRYTTKANIAIYRLMVIGLDAELQNVLYNLSYSKLEKAINDIRVITAKYRQIATDGNQGIATTVTKFIGEVEALFMDAIKIEYEYFIQKERIREEQKALRDQIRQEAAEQKQLEEERRRVEREESKYMAEIQNVQEQMVAFSNDQEKVKQLEERIAKIQAQLNEVEKKKDDIVNLQHGKAGYIYVISNLGSFGENIFKIGMTRRLDPQERIDELGDASVPFRFDVHSFIFSNSAPDLEASLHKKLHDKRVNKVNLKKEFFQTTIDDLEEMVYSLEPSAEFNRTMLAEQYYQSMAVNEIPETVTMIDEFDDDIVEE